MTVTRSTISDAVHELGLTGQPVCVHSSLTSFGWVEGGAPAVIDGLLSEGCTVLVPAFATIHFAPPISDFLPARNAMRYDIPIAIVGEEPRLPRIYSPEENWIDRWMGAIPIAVVATPGRHRGTHPTSSFAAVGPLARRLIEDQALDDIYAPLRALAELGGSVICMGVTLTSLTLLHLAEQMAGRELFRRWSRNPAGDVIMVQTGGCSRGFDNLRPVLAPLERETTVGESRWLVYPAAAALDAASATIRANPSVTHCDDPRCDHCNDAVAGGPIMRGA